MISPAAYSVISPAATGNHALCAVVARNERDLQTSETRILERGGPIVALLITFEHNRI